MGSPLGCAEWGDSVDPPSPGIERLKEMTPAGFLSLRGFYVLPGVEHQLCLPLKGKATVRESLAVLAFPSTVRLRAAVRFRGISAEMLAGQRVFVRRMS